MSRVPVHDHTDRFARADYTQVECPATLTKKTGCSRRDEQLQLASASLKTTSSSPPPASSPPPKMSPISSDAKLIIAICVPSLMILLGVGAYLSRSTCKIRQHQLIRSNIKILPAGQHHHNQLQSPAQSDDSHLYTPEIPPVAIQGLETRQIQGTNAVSAPELDMTPRVDKTPWNSEWSVSSKPLPGLPAELKGSSICDELEGDFKSPGR